MTNENNELTVFLSAWTDAERTGDTTALAQMLTDDFVGVGPLGFMLPKQAWLTRHATGDLKYASFRLEEVQVRGYGDTALVTAHQAAETTYQGHAAPGHMRATLVLVRQSGTWRLAGIHMSFIAGTPGAPPIPGGA